MSILYNTTMLKALELFVLTFIPLFVAVDALGNVPLYIGLAETKSQKQRSHIITVSVTTATAIAILFMLIGKSVLRFIGVTIPDFQIAGGLLLFVIAITLLLPGGHKSSLSDGMNKDVAVFPLATPLITGPAVLTTTIMMLDSYGIWPTFLSLAANMAIVWLTLSKADVIMKAMGESGTRAFAKIMYILLAAIGIMMIRKGVTGVLHL